MGAEIRRHPQSVNGPLVIGVLGMANL